VPERDIRKALKKRVEEYGGEIRAVKWIGRRNAPDVLCLFPVDSAYAGRVIGRVGAFDPADLHPFVEAKAPNGQPTSAQSREHKRMRRSHCVVLVVSTFKQLDEWLPPRA